MRRNHYSNNYICKIDFTLSFRLSLTPQCCQCWLTALFILTTVVLTRVYTLGRTQRGQNQKHFKNKSKDNTPGL